MELLALGLCGFVVVAHVGFMVLEMFMWTTPFGMKTFGRTPQQAEDSKVLAANQGLYNGFLAAGLAWGLLPGAHGHSIKLFFLGCVIVAGVFGAMTVSRKILLVQTLPGAVAMILVLIS